MVEQGGKRPTRVTIVSPHLDDGVLSIGGTIHALTRRGSDVGIVTVFGGDPNATTPPSSWDAKRGTPSQGDAVRLRRQEDAAAGAVLAATTTTLPWADSDYVASRDPDAIWQELRPALEPSGLIMLPGYPLSHADHRYTTMLVLERIDPTIPIVFYAELPYAAEPLRLVKARLRERTVAPLLHAYGADIDWRLQRLTRPDRKAKALAISKYAGELEALGFRARWNRIHDRFARGEWLGMGRRAEIPRGLLVDR